jgi:hypothetical protein
MLYRDSDGSECIGISPELSFHVKIIIELPVNNDVLAFFVVDWYRAKINLKLNDLIIIFWREPNMHNSLFFYGFVVKDN